MKTLLYKQLRLACHPMTPVFCLSGIMLLIPNYPYSVAFFYVTLGLFFTFLNMREQRDIYYSALLPPSQAGHGACCGGVHGAGGAAVGGHHSFVLPAVGKAAARQG